MALTQQLPVFRGACFLTTLPSSFLLSLSSPGVCAALTQKTLQGLSRNSYLYSAELALYGQVCLALLIWGKYLCAADGKCRALPPSLPPSLPPFLATSLTFPSLPPSPFSVDAPSFSLPKGLRPLTLLPIVMNAAGGIIVGLVTKYAGGE